jgi:group I intron endonuclease
MEIKIYGLVDHRNNEIRYVGKTKRQLNKRLYEHIYNKRTIRTYKSNWITALRKENLNPLIIELEICNENNWIEREQYWINKIDNLTNLTKGGEDGSWTFTDESIKQMSEQAKKRWENPEYRKRQTKIIRKKWDNQEYKKTQILAFGNVGRKHSDEYKKNMSLIKSKKPILIEGVTYNSINEAAKLIPMKKGKIKGRIKSKNFPEYSYK